MAVPSIFGDRYVLTTSRQNFVLDQQSIRLLQYRVVSMMYMFSVDGEGVGELANGWDACHSYLCSDLQISKFCLCVLALPSYTWTCLLSTPGLAFERLPYLINKLFSDSYYMTLYLINKLFSDSYYMTLYLISKLFSDSYYMTFRFVAASGSAGDHCFAGTGGWRAGGVGAKRNREAR